MTLLCQILLGRQSEVLPDSVRLVVDQGMGPENGRGLIGLVLSLLKTFEVCLIALVTVFLYRSSLPVYSRILLGLQLHPRINNSYGSRFTVYGLPHDRSLIHRCYTAVAMVLRCLSLPPVSACFIFLSFLN
jgi:hypothetical protein